MQRKLHEAFRKFSNKVSTIVGSPWTFIAACLVILLWAVAGPIFGFSDTWQLVINTSTTIITFLMVFIIQNTQNRDNEAIQLKLDELIRAQKNARNSMMDLEELSDEEIKTVQAQFDDICTRRATQSSNQDQAQTDADDNSDDNVNDDGNGDNTGPTRSGDKIKAMAHRN